MSTPRFLQERQPGENSPARYVLTTRRHGGTQAQQEDNQPLKGTVKRLTPKPEEQFAENARLAGLLRRNPPQFLTRGS